MSTTPQNNFKGSHVYQKNLELFTARAYEAIGMDYTKAYSTVTGTSMPVQGYSGIPVCLKAAITDSAEEGEICSVENADYTNYALYTGVNEHPAPEGRPVAVRTSGIVWFPVGAIAVTLGDWVQLTPDIKGLYSAGAGATLATCVAGDVIPTYTIQQVVHGIAAYTADAAETLLNSRSILKIVSAIQFTGSPDSSYTNATLNSTPAVTSTLAVNNNGFAYAAAAAAGSTGTGEIALIGAAGQYGTTFQIGDTLTDSIIILQAWVKGKEGAPHNVGQSLTAGSARTSVTATDYVAVKLRGI